MDIEEQPATLDSAAAPPAAPSLESPEIDSELDPNGQPDPDEIEEELEGIKLRGKKDALEKLKSERLMQADYTRKTQEVAEQRKAFEQERESHQRAVQLQQQYLNEAADLRAIDRRMQALQQHLPTAQAQDPQQAQALLIELHQLQTHRGQLVGSLTQKQQQQAFQQQQETVKRLEQGRAVLERDIKGWSPDLARKLIDFGASVGIPQQVLANVNDPAFVKLLHKAYTADQLEKAAAKKAPAPTPVGRVGGGSASNAKPLSDVTDPREWQKRRQEWKTRK